MLTQNRSDSFSVTHDWALQEWGLKPTSLLYGEHGRGHESSGASFANALFRAARMLRPSAPPLARAAQRRRNASRGAQGDRSGFPFGLPFAFASDPSYSLSPTHIPTGYGALCNPRRTRLTPGRGPTERDMAAFPTEMPFTVGPDPRTIRCTMVAMA
jgi:hypothetical protein